MTLYSETDEFSEKALVIKRMSEELKFHLNINFDDFINNNFLSLEIGGSGGVLSGIVSEKVGRVICTDIVDCQKQYNGEFLRLLKEKFERNDKSIDLTKIECQVVNAQDLPYKDSLFDFIFSLNAFEHIPDPIQALEEAIRVLKPGGFLYITFDPIWTADTGSHFFEYVNLPWAHLLMSDDQYCELMASAGAEPHHINSFKLDMNRLPYSFYRKNIPALMRNLKVQFFNLDEWSGCVDNNFKEHKNLKNAAEKLECSISDLLVRGFCLILRK